MAKVLNTQINVNFEGAIMELNDALSNISNQIAGVAEMARCSTKEIEELCKVICDISNMYGCSAEEAGEALRAMSYRLANQTENALSLADHCYNEIYDLQSARADTSARIAALESKEPFQIFEEEFEHKGIPMKIIMDQDKICFFPTQEEKPVKLVFENENIDDWYNKFINDLDKSFD